MFRVGQKVVCVDASGTSDCCYPLTQGAIYTIAGAGYFERKYLLDLVEVPTPVPHAWYPYRFRPIVERKTDISFAHEILRKANGRVDA